MLIKSLATMGCGYNLKFVIFKLISRIDILSISTSEIVIKVIMLRDISGPFLQA